MSHSKTVLGQMFNIFSRHEFEALANKHHTGRKFRKTSRWGQFVAMLTGQLSSRVSLRDLISNLSVQSHKLYHLGFKKVNRSTLARVNESKSYLLYEELFQKLLSRCKSHSPRHKFKFKNKLYSIDSSTIDLCLNSFPWASFRKHKGGIKLHMGLDHSGYLPTFVSVSEARKHDVTWAKRLNLPKNSYLVFDRGYTDYNWFESLINKGIIFVTRQKTNATYRVIRRNKANRKMGIICDQIIQLTGKKGASCPPLRRIRYKDQETGKVYIYLTNAFKLCAKTIANIYKERWQIEIFFKWIKQNLKIKTFYGTSENAVLTQIWIAMITYLMLCWIKWSQKIKCSLQEILRVLQLNLFEKRDFLKLINPKPEEPPENPFKQLLLAIS